MCVGTFLCPFGVCVRFETIDPSRSYEDNCDQSLEPLARAGPPESVPKLCVCVCSLRFDTVLKNEAPSDVTVALSQGGHGECTPIVRGAARPSASETGTPRHARAAASTEDPASTCASADDDGGRPGRRGGPVRRRSQRGSGHRSLKGACCHAARRPGRIASAAQSGRSAARMRPQGGSRSRDNFVPLSWLGDGLRRM